MNDDRERVPFSMKRRQRIRDHRLPQDMSADEDINAVANAADRDRQRPEVNLGFARMKGHRT